MKASFARAAATLCCVSLSTMTINSAVAQQRPAFVIVERTATTGPESIQEEYAKLAREILPKYGARYLARSQHNMLLEGVGAPPCCMAILEFPSLDEVERWYKSPENQDAVKVRDRGAKFGLIAIEGLPAGK